MKSDYEEVVSPVDNKKYYFAVEEADNIKEIPLKEFLAGNYPDILDSLRSDGIIVDNLKWRLFKEVKSDDCVVGYVTYDILEEFTDYTILVLNSYYIIGKYHDYGLIVDDIIETGFSLGFNVVIRYPSRCLVEALVKKNVATRVDESIVLSDIPLLCDTVSLSDACNCVVEDYVLDKSNASYSISTIYDVDLCGVVCLTSSADKVYDGQELDESELEDYCSIGLATRCDDERFDCLNKRRKVLPMGDYFKSLASLLEDYEEN